MRSKFVFRLCAERLRLFRLIRSSLFLRVDIAVASLNNQACLINANLDLPALASLAQCLWIVAEAVLPSEFFGDLGEGLRNSHHAVAIEKASTGRAREVV